MRCWENYHPRTALRGGVSEMAVMRPEIPKMMMRSGPRDREGHESSGRYLLDADDDNYNNDNNSNE